MPNISEQQLLQGVEKTRKMLQQQVHCKRQMDAEQTFTMNKFLDERRKVGKKTQCGDTKKRALLSKRARGTLLDQEASVAFKESERNLADLRQKQIGNEKGQTNKKSAHLIR